MFYCSQAAAGFVFFQTKVAHGLFRRVARMSLKALETRSMRASGPWNAVYKGQDKSPFSELPLWVLVFLTLLRTCAELISFLGSSRALEPNPSTPRMLHQLHLCLAPKLGGISR